MENGLSNSSKRSLKISLLSPKRNLKKKPVRTHAKHSKEIIQACYDSCRICATTGEAKGNLKFIDDRKQVTIF